MSQTTTSTSTSRFEPYTGDHEGTMTYAQSIENFSVPSPIAEATGIDDLSDFNGFEHRGHTFITSPTITKVRRGLHFEHTHASSETEPQSGITPHSAFDRTISTLADTFDSWFESSPAGYDGPTGDGAVDPQALYKRLMLEDPLNWREQSSKVPYARESHREIIVSALALLLDAVGPHKVRDQDAQREAARERLRWSLTRDISTTLSRDEAVAVVHETYDDLE